ncbi:hypothetical protein BKA62DRAFT_264382 [Auriculariales sp. MPI-PUGE-AT-0066]|nr:hypothetical protein BKA62DRAFT_264382 [Auriculariales sp. MPI-PUGE-AT-0066]
MMAVDPTRSELALANSIFLRADAAERDIISSDTAFAVFTRSRLPPRELGEIWAIVIRDNTGYVTRREVALALRLIGWAQSGKHLHQSLLGHPGPEAYIDGYMNQAPAVPRKGSPRRATYDFPQVPTQWDISAGEKAQSDTLLDDLGQRHSAFADARIVLPFLVQSTGLQQKQLDQAWSLLDTDRTGFISRDHFAVLMRLVDRHLSGEAIPATLPPTLVPPSMPRSVVATPAPIPDTGWSMSSSVVSSPIGFPQSPSQPWAQQPSWRTPISTQPGPSTLTVAIPQAHPVSHLSQVVNNPPGKRNSQDSSDLQCQIATTLQQVNSTRQNFEMTQQEVIRGTEDLADLRSRLVAAKATLEAETRMLAEIKRRRAQQLQQAEQTRYELDQVERNLATVRLEADAELAALTTPEVGLGARLERNETWHPRNPPHNDFGTFSNLRPTQSQRLPSSRTSTLTAAVTSSPLRFNPASTAVDYGSYEEPKLEAVSDPKRPLTAESWTATGTSASASTSSSAVVQHAKPGDSSSTKNMSSTTDEPPPAYNEGW